MGKTIDGPAGSLNVDDGGGTGMPVLFVHSFGGSAAHWRGQLAHLRRHRRAAAMELRGHGESGAPPDGDYSVPALAQDVAAVADALELRRFVLVGHSMGGAAAAAYVGSNADRVAGLVLVGTPGKSDAARATQIMASLRADYDKVMAGYWDSLMEGAEPAVRELLEAEMRRMEPDAALSMISAIFDFDPLPALRAYGGSLLLIDADHGDSPTALHHQLPDATRKRVTDTSHWPHLDKPQEFNRLLDDFLAWIA